MRRSIWPAAGQFPPSPFGSANITPDKSGKRAGLTFERFLTTLRTGHNPLDRPSTPQVMPWPVFGKKTDGELRAVYEYLRAMPSLPDNDSESVGSLSTVADRLSVSSCTAVAVNAKAIFDQTSASSFAAT